MKKIITIQLAAMILLLAVPLCAAAFSGRLKNDVQLHSPFAMREGKRDFSVISVYDTANDKVIFMPLEAYIKCVVAAEMPASFETEALKAQAVAARTYSVYKMQNLIKPQKHKGADVCTDFACCKAFRDEEAQKKSWGKNYESNRKKIADAVELTTGEIMIYDNKPICAVFHAMSSGHTEASADVWGGNLPYLNSVESVGDTFAPNYETQVNMSSEKFFSTIKQKYPESFVECSSEKAVGETIRSEAGGIKEITLCSVKLKGTQARTLFGLRSTNFELNFADNEFVFKVKGYGHGVGMSQQGAQFMAKQGSSYRDILKHYYSGVSFSAIAL